MTQTPEKFCNHENGMAWDGGPRPMCLDCGAPMTWVTVQSLTDWADVRIKIRNLVLAEEQVLKDRSISQRERIARKATRDAYRLVIDILDESGVT